MRRGKEREGVGGGNHGDEIEPDAEGGGHAELDAVVRLPEPHLVPQVEVLLHELLVPPLLLEFGDGQVDVVDPLVPLRHA